MPGLTTVDLRRLPTYGDGQWPDLGEEQHVQNRGWDRDAVAVHDGSEHCVQLEGGVAGRQCAGENVVARDGIGLPLA